jgi:flagellar biosynthesis/type III secretory pathway protein FliH
MEIWCFPPLDEGEAIVAKAVVEMPVEPDAKDSSQEENEKAILNHLHYLASVGMKMTERLAEIDEHFMHNTLLLIKKTVKKIILKELITDDSLLPEMVLQAVDNLKPLSDPCVVYVSEEDHALFQQMPQTSLKIEVNPELQKGDFLIKTPFTEVEALLDKRLAALFGLES